MIESLITLAQSSNSGGGLGALVVFAFWLAFVVLIIAGFWKTFTKAGYPGWCAIIPIVNIYFLCKIGGRPGWWVLLFFIPIVSFVISIILSVDIARAFGKGILFAIGLILLSPIFYCILGFGSAQYQGPSN